MNTQSEKQGNKVTFINGEFSVPEALEHLMKLYEDNRRYHGARAFSTKIRFGTPDEQAEAILRALEQAKSETLALLDDASNKSRKIKIETAVTISLDE